MAEAPFGIGETQQHVLWCWRQYEMLAEEGVWAVPRSGLVFTKRGGGFVLTAAMPHEAGMPMSADELREYQQEDFDVIREMFAKAGVEVTGSPDDVREVSE